MSSSNQIRVPIPGVLYLLVIMWVVYGVEMILLGDLSSWGIMPRDFGSLVGILFAPFLHNGLWHLMGNSIPLVILGVMIQMSNQNDFWDITIIIILITGLGVWLIGSPAYHVGASGLVMGFWSYLIADGWYERSIRSAILAVVTIVAYGWLVYVFIDVRAHVSWSSHVIGVVAGISVAWVENWLRQRKGEGTAV